MWERVRTLVAVVVVTWLIWWTADRRVTDRDEVTVRLAVKTAEPNLYATIDSPQPPDVLAVLAGTRGRLESFRAQLQRGTGRVFEYTLPTADAVRGTLVIPAAKVLLDSKGFRESGLDVLAVRPGEIRVVVDRYEDVRLRVEPDFGTIGVENVVCQPPQVDVRRLTAMLARTRFADGVLRPSAEVAVRQWIAAHPGEAEFQIDLTLTIPDAPQLVEISPSSQVRVSGRFVSLLNTVRKGPVQVVFAVPPDVQRRFIIKPTEASNLRPDVYIRGPKADAEQLSPQQIFVYVEVLAADAAGTLRTIRRAPKVILPPGIELDREMQEIEFELVERAAGADTDEVGQ